MKKSEFDIEFKNAANQIALVLGKELKDKQSTPPESLNEALITSIIVGILAGNAIVGFIAKIIAKLMKKFKWEKSEDFAKKIYSWSHDNEIAFQAPIKRILAFFIKDKTKLDITVKAIYAIIIASMAANYGVNALASLKKADWFQASLTSLVTLAKSDEALVNAYPVIKALIA
jgi:hypothetical protein